MAAVQRVLVIGGGIGGLFTARALRLKGIAVDLIEKQPDWTVYGVGIIQPNNALRAFERVGLAQACLERGGAFEGWRIHDVNGKVLIEAHGAREAAPHLPPNNGIPRPILHEILIEGAKSTGTDIRLGVTATRIADDGAGVDVDFSDGVSRRYDLVVGFDGAFSDTRKLLFGDRYTPTFTGQGVWRYNLPRPPEVDTGGVFFGPDTKIGLTPMSPTQMYMFVVTPEADNRWLEGPQLADEMRRRVAAYGGPIPALAAQIVDPAEVVYRPMMHVMVTEPWYRGRVMIAGDAAHATTPHLAQGAAMAIEDGVLLAELLAAEDALEPALQAFMARRYDRAKYVVDVSNQLAEWELEEWAGVHNPDANPGALLHSATHALMADY
ncbi:FAD-dependent oxidoreductase [Sphingomonas sp. LT1P40]|uniref:FAD-dependent oxidoreductase n=1 Tax=Alteristakelama amylovorans TaxID=3096166 RepID=UPI002FCC23F8